MSCTCSSTAHPRVRSAALPRASRARRPVGCGCESHENGVVYLAYRPQGEAAAFGSHDREHDEQRSGSGSAASRECGSDSAPWSPAFYARRPFHAPRSYSRRYPRATPLEARAGYEGRRHRPVTTAASSGRPRGCSRSATKSRWRSWIATEPSPTADATRFTEPCRTSPAAKTPGVLVSSRSGLRSSGQEWLSRRSDPVRTKPRASLSISGGSHLVCGRAPIMRKSPLASTVSSRPSV
jgi:hypothetical protein